MYDYLIVGAGLYGAVFAHEAKKAGKSGYRIACDQTPARAPKAEDTMSSAVQLKALLSVVNRGNGLPGERLTATTRK